MNFFAKLFGRKTKAVEPIPVVKAPHVSAPRYVERPSYPPRRVKVTQAFVAAAAPAQAQAPVRSDGIGFADVLILNAMLNNSHASGTRTSDTCAAETAHYSSGGGGDFGGAGASSSWGDSSGSGSSSSSYSSSDSSSSSSDSGSSSSSSSSD